MLLEPNQSSARPDVPTICTEIRVWHRQRVFAMEQRKRTDLALGAFLRTQLGWTKDGDKAINAAAREGAAAIIAHADRVVAGRTADEPEGYAAWADFAEGTVAARRPMDKIEAAALRNMKRLARELPIWERFRDTKGVGEASIAVIVGEAGDLSIYDREAKLWKRMGVGVMGPGDGLHDHAQGHPGAGASAADWIAEGYSKLRRSRMFVIGDSLVKCDGPYRAIYLKRKAYEIARAEALGLIVAPSAKIPKNRAAEFRSDGHIHRRAQRYLEKRLLRHLWRAWRGNGPP